MSEDAQNNASLTRRGHRTAAACVAGVLLLAGVLIAHFAQAPLPPNTGFMPAFGAMIVLTDGLSAVLLLVQSHMPGDRRVRRLGAAYLFSALIVMPHLLAFPGVFAQAPIIGGPQSAVWLWCFWHGGFALGVLRFLRTPAPAPPQWRWTGVAATVAAIAAALTLVATIGTPWLPALLVNGDFRGLIWTGIGPAVVVLNIVALVLSFVRQRWNNPLHIWLSVALLAASLDAALTVFGGGRFTLGWYSARVLSLLTGVTILFSLLAELMREAGRVAEVNQQLERMLLSDVLTQVANRRGFDQALAAEWARAFRDRSAISILLIDIDFFKGYNDRYGHPAGDDCLQQVARALRDSVRRPADLVARMGGEEFAILLPATEEAGAWDVAQRALGNVSELRIQHDASELGIVTISLGIATVYPSDMTETAALAITRADTELYRAKRSGRNRISGVKTREMAAA